MSDLHHSPENGSERPRLSWFERVCAFGVQLISAGAMIAVVNLVALPLSTTAAQASVAGAMDSYFDDMGAAANVTGPTAFDGQRAGYYSLGNVWTRFPQRTPTSPTSSCHRRGRGAVVSICSPAASRSSIRPRLSRS